MEATTHSELELFWISGSPYAWRVLLALQRKGLAFESRLLQMSRGDLRTPEHLAMNPRGRVPVLRIGGSTVICESLAILAYLERAHPEVPIFGRDARETGAIWQILSEYTSYMDAAVEEIIVPIYFGQIPEKADAIRAAAPVVHRELARYEKSLAAAPDAWLAGGEEPTAADFTLMPAIESLLRAGGKPDAEPLELGLVPIEKRYPAIGAWAARVRALPGYGRTIPPHWKLKLA